MTPHPLRRDRMCSPSQACLPGNVTGFQDEVWGHKECTLNPKRVRLYQELLHLSPATQSAMVLSWPSALKRDSCQVRAQVSYLRSSNAAEAGLKTLDTSVKTGQEPSLEIFQKHREATRNVCNPCCTALLAQRNWHCSAV